jgi:hypothetical protein
MRRWRTSARHTGERDEADIPTVEPASQPDARFS